ncbi:hypothetical protein Q0Z83_020990 [Actinoplanes sichuanensis]|uniref:Kazal-like domain-containing protein n=1 Tax=Actinoplanes sichuanensis TaxID=512349 RepID=A0ABW4AIU8_9ACTN|nr:hypothetical protein [Actinoplanes sichuanensis]BEL03908.1 hypothetical protein Q0Z83_020990 [Actinoplanes sichuanensis]
MRERLGLIGDRMLAALLPKERAGACPCRPGEGYYQYRCVGLDAQRRWCVDSCNCSVSCGSRTKYGLCT